MNDARPALILAGPTASGKSALAIKLAKRHGFAIVSADSMQVYRGMEIGTAQPSEAERDGVPHHLLGVADPRDDFHAARFAAAAAEAIRAEAAQGRRTLVVGGTGLWIRALREGLFAGPGRDEAIREELRRVLGAEGPAGLHALLAKEDPAVAARLSPADHVRVVRALEVLRLTGRSIDAWQEEDRARRARLGPLAPLVVLTAERAWLHDRIERRVRLMLESGWLVEAERLLELNLPGHAPARKALGYRDLFRVLRGEATLEQVTPQIILATRQFAKRQATWFRSERSAVFAPTETSLHVAEELIAR